MKVDVEYAWSEWRTVMKRYIQHRMSDQNLVDDILQEVFLKIHLNIQSIHDINRLRSWMFRICRNTIIDHYRKQQIMTQLPESIVSEALIEEKQFQKNIDSCIQMMIHKLSDKYRQAVVMTVYENLTRRELSDLLGISVSGAKSRVQRAREKLKTELLNCCHLEFDRFGKIIDYTPKNQ